jgi:Fe-S-cluster containining protein
MMVSAYKRLKKAEINKIKKTKATFCPFLLNGSCSVYAARPIICRTHGLPILYKGKLKSEISVCRKNFKKSPVAEIDNNYLFDTEMITANLMRLNLALSLELGDAALADTRFYLRDICKGTIPDTLYSL